MYLWKMLCSWPPLPAFCLAYKIYFLVNFQSILHDDLLYAANSQGKWVLVKKKKNEIERVYFKIDFHMNQFKPIVFNQGHEYLKGNKHFLRLTGLFAKSEQPVFDPKLIYLWSFFPILTWSLIAVCCCLGSLIPST